MAKRNVTPKTTSAFDIPGLRVKVLQARSTALLMGKISAGDVPDSIHSWAGDSVYDLLTDVADAFDAAELAK